MEKLIELLEFKDGYEDISYRKQSDGAYVFWLDGMAYREERLLGKKFGFIKRLVENDKIDFDKLVDNADWYYIDTGNDYLDILALLSIQDNPIDFLISILK